MFRRDLLRCLMATPLRRWLRPWAQSVFDAAATEVPNAADLYRKAFGWAEGLRPEESERLREAAKISIDDQRVCAMIQQVRPVLKAVRQAAALDQCRWGTGTVTSDDLGKGHLNVSNLNVIRAACLSARWHARAGNCRDALNDAFAGLTLAHRIGTGGLVLARVLECGGEVTSFETLGRILPGLERAALEDLSRRLAALPPPEPASAVIGPESRFRRSNRSTRSRRGWSSTRGASATWSIGCEPCARCSMPVSPWSARGNPHSERRRTRSAPVDSGSNAGEEAT
jgi:hypothetical protein